MFDRRWTRAMAFAVAAAMAMGAAACGDDSADGATTPGTTDGPTATLDSPADGAHVAGGVAVAMSADGVTIEPAGEANDGAGHFHVIADDGCTAAGAAIARDADHVHFGKGQSEGVIYLGPGSHELCLQVGDGTHVATELTDTVTIEVGIEDQLQWCAVVAEVDQLFEVTDSSDDEFASKQAGYANINRLLTQLSASIDLVDEASRDDVEQMITFSTDLTDTVVSATDEAAANTAVDKVYAEVGAPPMTSAAEWIDATCGVKVDE
jgi:hypothetical protein